ncbi:hypothetical protein [Paraburkholderia sacchari]|uniref:Uncharacterized protein n=1 Tax=Paraburkholderia sacchari TaxID=159450 RepID=A0A8T6Z3T1_9BURK|nr:hypothetical protein [Paraburkholderia sacchari]NLP60007.1 hypothetical protein [Paraburkholderia sacchari]
MPRLKQACPFFEVRVENGSAGKACRKWLKMRVAPREFAVFVYIASMATIPQITFVSKIHGTARAISLAIDTQNTTKTIITKTIITR